MRIIEIADIGEVKLIKSRLAKRITLKVNSKGEPIVMLPKLAPYTIGKKFAVQHINWIKEQLDNAKDIIVNNGSRIGANHLVRFNTHNVIKISSRVKNDVITINYPKNLSFSDKAVQAEAQKAAIRALKAEASADLPEFLYEIAREYGYKYKSVNIKKMHSRWGSCTSAGNIALSIWLMQLPEEIKRYVLCHELAHLKYPHHQADFWSAVEIMVPDYKKLRKQLKNYEPKLMLT